MSETNKKYYTEREIDKIWSSLDDEDFDVEWDRLPLWEKAKWHIMGKFDNIKD